MLIRWLLIYVLLFVPTAWAGPTILVFGDSLSANYGVAVESGWVSLLQQRLMQNQYKYQVVNASISGETTAGGLTRIDTALATHKPAIVIVELGANDGLRGLPLQAMRDNLDGTIRACIARRAKVLLVGMRLPPNYGTAYNERFSMIYPALANKYHTALLPFLLEGMADKRDMFQADNLHPTAAAQPIVLENVWKRLRPLL
ncbi:esterase TesA [Sulfurimicrobium lacus]|uniref:Esterase TesA n=1 Tax=Sulfurimicrobium lacus TaxID=2715678 RepID=A0A6F8VFT5_9PROT|nr:arylesterase [Sulfurimicrobium lacus]BCB27812.1 esterase TesA [Sulfurimicrobium lacus]